MQNGVNSIPSELCDLRLTSKARQHQQELPAGTVANEHNINGADYQRIGKDNRVHFRV